MSDNSDKYEWEIREVLEATAQGLSTLLHVAAALLLKSNNYDISDILRDSARDIDISLGGPEVADVYERLDSLVESINKTADTAKKEGIQAQFELPLSGKHDKKQSN